MGSKVDAQGKAMVSPNEYGFDFDNFLVCGLQLTFFVGTTLITYITPKFIFHTPQAGHTGRTLPCLAF